MFHMLDKLKHTATGPDGLPASFLRLGAAVFAAPLQIILNLSALTSVVPTQWKSAIIKPLPKVMSPTAQADYRLISITSVISRTVERFIDKS